MARPTQPIQPAEPLLIVDGKTAFELRSPALMDPHGAPYAGRTVHLALVASNEAGTRLAPIHPSLAGTGASQPDGSYTLTVLPRDLWLRLATHAHRVIYVRTTSTEHDMHFAPVRVVWRADTYPTPERT